ncbi:aldehyde ferredoxin oxidoreductase family protein [Desulfovermiculus halophilus]|uniref:aldehyde ferredoxin oxidoreductase family protein n=1 Tax=Desulfovermiculus halophilus TaxID=339722 RepID=UPI0004875590|nr:aldehyde ferredoxin oxidoreductase family protein [Desulfovermiculus halophilus]
MPKAWMGKFLFVDLGSGSSWTQEVPDWMRSKLMGGKAFGAKLLTDLTPAGCDPFAPENPLMIMTGPLTGTSAPSMRGCVVTKSPLTGTFLDSYFGGYFSPEVKYAGYDGIIILGQAQEPVYLWIDDDRVEVRPAAHLWGQDALEANAAVKSELNDETVKILSIGPAGENRVLYSLISCEYNRQAGRGGAGAVMGSKHLKAIAVRGTNTVTIHDPEAFRAAVIQANADLEKSEDVQAMRDGGTAPAVDFANETGLLPSRNFQDGSFEKASNLSDIGQSKHLWLNSAACLGCPIRCSKMGAVRTGKYAGFITDIVEYESAALMGSNLGISDVRAVAHLVKLCDRFGMDSMSTGGVIGFAMEAGERGLLESPDGISLEFGNVQAAEYLIRSIAFVDNDLGKLLAQGVKRAAAALGGDASAFAQHVKGLESPAWGPRGAAGTGLAFMTADRGGCHQRGLPAPLEVTGGEWEGKPVQALAVEGKADMLIQMQNYLAGTDALVKCDFGGFGVQPETYAALLSAATGERHTADEFDRLGERIWNLTRNFNLREGLNPADDTLPKRFMQDPLPSGPNKGHRFSAQDMAFMLKDYYSLRGWDQAGRPTEETLKKVGVQDLPKFEKSS